MIKNALRRAVEWPRIKKKEFEMLGLTAPRGILLHGPPVSSKTLFYRLNLVNILTTIFRVVERHRWHEQQQEVPELLSFLSLLRMFMLQAMLEKLKL